MGWTGDRQISHPALQVWYVGRREVSNFFALALETPVQNGTVSLSVKMHVPWLTPHEVVERVLLPPHEVVERVPLSAAHHVVEPGRAAPAPQGEELAPGMTVSCVLTAIGTKLRIGIHTCS